MLASTKYWITVRTSADGCYLVHPEAILAPNSMLAPPRNPSNGATPAAVPQVPERWAERPAPAIPPNQKATCNLYRNKHTFSQIILLVWGN